MSACIPFIPNSEVSIAPVPLRHPEFTLDAARDKQRWISSDAAIARALLATGC
jgi:hypothetical protein